MAELQGLVFEGQPYECDHIRIQITNRNNIHIQLKHPYFCGPEHCQFRYFNSSGFHKEDTQAI